MRVKVVGLDKLNQENMNGRIYPQEVVKQALKTYNEQFVKDSKAFICDRPPEGGVLRIDTIVGQVTKTELKDHALYVHLKPLKISANQSSEIWRMFKKGQLRVCMAALGTVVDKKVQSDLEVLSFYFDLV